MNGLDDFDLNAKNVDTDDSAGEAGTAQPRFATSYIILTIVTTIRASNSWQGSNSTEYKC